MKERSRSGGILGRARRPDRASRAPRIAPASPDDLRPWQLIRYAPRSVWLVTALFALILAGWSVLAPLYHASDEPNHADAVMRLEEGRGWPSSMTATVTDQGVGATAASPYGIGNRRLAINYGPIPAAAAPGRHDRPTWQDLKALPGTSGRLQQQSTQHPPGYYWYEAVLLRLGGAAGWRWDIAVSAMRLLSALLIVWLPLLAFATAWRVSGRRLAGVAASIIPLGVPELTHVGASVNNDNLITLAGATTLLGVTCAMCGDRSRSTALWTGLWLAVALWAKAFGLVLVPLVILVYAAPWIRDRWDAWRASRQHPKGTARERTRWRPDRRTTVLLSLSAGVAILLGCWWYVASEIHYGTGQPGTPNFAPGKYIGHDNWLFLRVSTQIMLERWWGSVGWFEVNIPWRTVAAASLLVGGLGSYGLARLRGRRLPLLMLLWPTVATYAMVVGDVTHYYLTTHYVRGLSGRYLFIGLTGVAAMIGIGCALLPRKVARWTPLALLVGALGIQLEQVHLAVDHWWRPVNGTLRQAWSALSAWSTWPVGVLFTGIVLLGLLIVACLVTFVRYGARGVDSASPAVLERIGVEPAPVDVTSAVQSAPAGGVAGAAEAAEESSAELSEPPPRQART